jgi:two-component sensor histidine kinase
MRITSNSIKLTPHELLTLQGRIPPGSAEAYALATCLVAIAGLVRWALGFLTDELMPFTTFYPAVLFGALIGGIGPGIFATVLGGVIAYWLFMRPQFGLFPLSMGQQIGLLTYFVASALIVWATDYNRRLSQRLVDEERFRELAVRELAHRLRNKIATIQSIISFQLRDSPQVRDRLLNRLTALSNTDRLIEDAQGVGAKIGGIIAAELSPYGASRIATEGPDVLLPPKLALTMALLVHELATNAAKYGALSAASGELTVRWSVSGKDLQLVWQECAAPLHAGPSRRGFGMLLLSRALDQFGGTVETNFGPTGLICKMKLTIPQSRAGGIAGDYVDQR